MKNTSKDFEKLNLLLVSCFEAEKLYFDAAQDAQNTELKRFLNFMAVERNRMANSISNELSSRNIEPFKSHSKKESLLTNSKERLQRIEEFDVEQVLNNCIHRDQINLDRYTELINEAKLPSGTLELLYKDVKNISWYIKQTEQHKVDPLLKEATTRKEALGKVSTSSKSHKAIIDQFNEEHKDTSEDAKVINLKAM